MIYLSFSKLITWSPRKLYPDFNENVPGAKGVRFERSDLLGFFILFDLPSPSVAKAPTAEIAKRTIKANFLLRIFNNMEELVFNVPTNLSTKMLKKQTVCPEY